MEFQQRLYELRKQAGLSQEGLANLLGISRQAVQKWESGASSPDLDNLVALARFFKVSVDYLATGEAVCEPPKPVVTAHRSYYHALQFEYKSRRTLFGLPLVHVRFGPYNFGVARGIFAVGNIAVGVFTLGGLSFGVFSLGGLCVGLLLSLGGIALGGFAVGGLAVGLLAIGGCAVGLVALGGGAFGAYAIGGGAVGTKIAIGSSAKAPLAIGIQSASGLRTYFAGTDPALLESAIRTSAAGLPHFLQDLLVLFACSL